jgi:hypothetical protein
MNAQKFTAEDAACPMNYPGFVFRELRKGGFEAEALLRGTALTLRQTRGGSNLQAQRDSLRGQLKRPERESES